MVVSRVHPATSLQPGTPMASPSEKPAIPAAVLAARSTLKLTIISLTEAHWDGDVREVSLPGIDGRFGVMAGHVPLMTTLTEGMVMIHPANGGTPVQFYVSGGFVEVQPGEVNLMADLALRGDDVDKARAQAAREAAISPMASNLIDEEYGRMHTELMHHFGANLRSFRFR